MMNKKPPKKPKMKDDQNQEQQLQVWEGDKIVSYWQVHGMGHYENLLPMLEFLKIQILMGAVAFAEKRPLFVCQKKEPDFYLPELFLLALENKITLKSLNEQMIQKKINNFAPWISVGAFNKKYGTDVQCKKGLTESVNVKLGSPIDHQRVHIKSTNGQYELEMLANQHIWYQVPSNHSHVLAVSSNWSLMDNVNQVGFILNGQHSPSWLVLGHGIYKGISYKAKGLAGKSLFNSGNCGWEDPSGGVWEEVMDNQVWLFEQKKLKNDHLIAKVALNLNYAFDDSANIKPSVYAQVSGNRANTNQCIGIDLTQLSLMALLDNSGGKKRKNLGTRLADAISAWAVSEEAKAFKKTFLSTPQAQGYDYNVFGFALMLAKYIDDQSLTGHTFKEIKVSNALRMKVDPMQLKSMYEHNQLQKIVDDLDGDDQPIMKKKKITL